MNILGIGSFEIVIILLIILLVLKPEDLEKTGKTVGQWINKITKSEGWMAVRSISKEVRGLPARLAREAELDSLKDQLDPEKMINPTPPLRFPEKKENPEPSASKPVKPNSAEPKPSSPAEKPTEKEKKQ